MSDKETKEKGKEEVRAEGRQGFAEMCRRMMSGGAPDCCGPQMREMMSRFCRSAGKAEGEAKG
jgi:hypothetical protein